MTYLLDTNVVSEATAKCPNANVVAWAEANSSESCLSCISVGEIWKGLYLLPEGKRRQRLSEWIAGIENDFGDRILALDHPVLKTWGKLYAKHEAKGFNMGILDSLIAATAMVHGLVVATRNASDFPAEVRTINPWAELT